jgi:hypothetical protein
MAKRAGRPGPTLALLGTTLLDTALLGTISNHIVPALVPKQRPRHYPIVPNRVVPALYDTNT